MKVGPRKARWLLALVGASVAVGVVLVVWLKRPHRTADDKSFPEPPYSQSAFLNTGPDAQYIGTAGCAECHRENHQSYLLTAHSRALSDVDPAAEPPAGSFEHVLSQRSYRVYHQAGQLRHEELLRSPEGKEIARVDLPVRYLIGSGNFARSYLAEVDGFLEESPITWYPAKKKWGLSPGYDFPVHASFERPVGVDCLACHAGRAAATDGSFHRMTFQEKAIGCENCHGPGSLHREFHRGSKLAPGEDDRTIVNPAKLSRPLKEAICSACHLSGPATVHVRGRKVGDFRPGMPLTDYDIHYRFENDGGQMTVVGHVEQLHQSACYQKSDDMTCLTCHDPHLRTELKEKTTYYRQKCLSCHTTKSCSLPGPERLKKDAADNCVTCHMPRGDTEIPHIAFTHHRIGKHTTTAAPGATGRIPELVPIGDMSRLTDLDIRRNQGLAYLEVARNPTYAAYAESFHERAWKDLEAVRAWGLRDGATAVALAEIYWTEKESKRARACAQEALAIQGAPGTVRAVALTILAYCDLEVRDYASAVSSLEELTRLRRLAEDWRLLGTCYMAQNQPRKALEAFQQALAIRPFRPTVHAGLAEAYRQLGDFPHAAEHLEKAQWLAQHRQD